jgi:hypothetical protein
MTDTEASPEINELLVDFSVILDLLGKLCESSVVFHSCESVSSHCHDLEH